MYDGGADIVYHAAGGSGGGVFEAAAEAGTPGRSVSTPTSTTPPTRRSQDVILTSMLKNVDVAVYDYLKAVDGRHVPGRRHHLRPQGRRRRLLHHRWLQSTTSPTSSTTTSSRSSTATITVPTSRRDRPLSTAAPGDGSAGRKPRGPVPSSPARPGSVTPEPDEEVTDRAHRRRARRGAAAAPAEIAVRLRGIGKRFPGVIANDDINIDVRRGTIHAIVGENGAGKSTLMKILYGVQPPDSGTIEINGAAGHARTRRPTPSSAGVGMVFQHFMLADNLTVLENVVLGAEKLHGIGGKARAEVKRDLRRLRPRHRARPPGRGRSASAPASASRSSRSSTAAPRSSSSTSRPRSWCRRRSTSSSATCASSRPRASASSSSPTSSTRCSRVADEITVIRRGTTVATVEPGRRHRPPARRADGRLRAARRPSTETSTVTDEVLLRGRAT